MIRRALLAVAVLLVTTASSSAQSISLTLRDGRVTLVTQNATPAAILAEWSRQGQVRVVDGERVPGTPLTLRLENVPEREALDIVLRGAAGYIAAPRAAAATGAASVFDRVIVMATSPGAAVARASTPPAASRPAAPMVQQAPAPVEEIAQDEPEVGAGLSEEPAVAAPEQPASSTNFDYANPQRYFAARQAEQQAAEAAVGALPGQAQQATEAPQPAADPSSPFGTAGATRNSPGMLPVPAPPAQNGGNGAAPINPYGLPANQVPGSAPSAPVEPDRAKYINPYAPTPPRP